MRQLVAERWTRMGCFRLWVGECDGGHCIEFFNRTYRTHHRIQTEASLARWQRFLRSATAPEPQARGRSSRPSRQRGNEA